VNVTLPGTFPVLSVVGVAGLNVSAAPSHVALRFDDPANPLPDTVTVVPVTPDDGARLMNEFTVNDVLAVWPLTDTCTVCEPFIAVGTVNPAPVNDPFPSVLVAGLIDNAPPSHVALTALDAGNAEPAIVTDAPTTPDVGFTVIDRVIVNCAGAVAWFVPSDTVTSSLPATLAGTANVMFTSPEPLLVLPLVIDADVPPTVSVSDVDGKNPAPVMVTEAPTFPDVGDGLFR
jgi:hypothetical protein